MAITNLETTFPLVKTDQFTGVLGEGAGNHKDGVKEIISADIVNLIELKEDELLEFIQTESTKFKEVIKELNNIGNGTISENVELRNVIYPTINEVAQALGGEIADIDTHYLKDRLNRIEEKINDLIIAVNNVRSRLELETTLTEDYSESAIAIPTQIV